VANNVTSKGQVTIPKNVRDRLGIAAGSAVAFELTDTGEVVLRAVGRRPARAPKSRFLKLRGRATVKMRTEEILALTRGR
jgi:antitoxin PrlF